MSQDNRLLALQHFSYVFIHALPYHSTQLMLYFHLDIEFNEAIVSGCVNVYNYHDGLEFHMATCKMYMTASRNPIIFKTTICYY